MDDFSYMGDEALKTFFVINSTNFRRISISLKIAAQKSLNVYRQSFQINWILQP